MRTMSTHVGTTGNNRRTEGLSEVQESVLEHSPAEASQKEELTRSNVAVKLGYSQVPFVYEVETKYLENPDSILSFELILPQGVSAKFSRSTGWSKWSGVRKAAVEQTDHRLCPVL